jgi:type IV pilus assembly protein PilA
MTARNLAKQDGLTMLELLIAMFIISILAMVGLPAYSDYIVRAKLSEDMATIQKVKLMVSEYYSVNGELPTENNQIGLDEKAKKVKGIHLQKMKITANPEPGSIKAWYDTSEFPELGSNNRIVFVPTPSSGGRLVWDCTRGNLPDKWRPANCRD